MTQHEARSENTEGFHILKGQKDTHPRRHASEGYPPGQYTSEGYPFGQYTSDLLVLSKQTGEKRRASMSPDQLLINEATTGIAVHLSNAPRYSGSLN